MCIDYSIDFWLKTDNQEVNEIWSQYFLLYLKLLQWHLLKNILFSGLQMELSELAVIKLHSVLWWGGRGSYIAMTSSSMLLHSMLVNSDIDVCSMSFWCDGTLIGSSSLDFPIPQKRFETGYTLYIFLYPS